MTPVLRNDRPPGWYKIDLVHATALALSIFRAEDRFVEVITSSKPPREPGPIARRHQFRSVENPNGVEAQRKSEG